MFLHWLRCARKRWLATPRRRPVVRSTYRPRYERLEDRIQPANYSGTLQSSQTWDSSDVRIITGNLDIPTGVKLTITASTQVRLNHDFNIVVDNGGELDATSATFTSNQAAPNPGDWASIQINPGGTANLQSVDVQYGGAGGREIFVNGPATPSQQTPLATFTLSGSTVESSSTVGLLLQHNDANVLNTTFKNNGGAAINMDLDSSPQLSNLSITGNQVNGVVVGGSIPTGGVDNGTVNWYPTNAAFFVTQDLAVPSGTALTIFPGNTIKLAGTRLVVNGGTLSAQGTDASHIVFTSSKASPAPGDWQQVQIQTGGSATLTDVDLHYGGAGNVGEVFVDGTGSPSQTTPEPKLTLKNSTLDSSSSDGMLIQHSDVQLTSDTFTNSGAAGIRMDADSSPTFSGFTASSFSNNAINGVSVSGTIPAAGNDSGTVTWNAPNVVYWVASDVVVPTGTTLNLSNPGQVVKFANARLVVNGGTLSAIGSDAAHIVFTSRYDDNVGGDTDNDSGATKPAPGNWQQVQIQTGGSATLTDVDLHYGGAGNVGEIFLDGTASPSQTTPEPKLTLKNSTLDSSSSDGMLIQHSDVQLTSDTFTNSGAAGIRMDADSSPTFSGFTASSFSNNAINGVSVSGTIPAAGNDSGTVTWNAPNVVYWVANDVAVPAGTTLNLSNPGQVVKFAGSRLVVNGGTLSAIGSDAAHIVFTSSKASPAPGDWQQVQIQTGGSATLTDVDLHYGGAGNVGEIFLDGTGSPSQTTPEPKLTLKNSTLDSSSSDGMLIQHSDVQLTSDTFTNSGAAGIRMDADSSPTFSGFTASSFSNNAINGVSVSGTIPAAGNDSGTVTWNAPNVVYWVANDVVVPTGTTLDLSNPGQVVKFANARLVVNGGTLSAIGSDAAHIVFTSRYDDNVGGDTDNDSGATKPAPGNWQQVQIQTGGSATLTDVDLHYGGAGNVGEIFLDGTASPSQTTPEPKLTLSNSTLDSSSGPGLVIHDSNPTLTADTFSNNTADAAITMDMDSNPVFRGFTTDSLKNNKINGVSVSGSIPTTGNAGGQLTWNAPGVVLWLAGDVAVPAGTSLTVVPGQVVKLPGSRLLVNGGTLTAVGGAAPSQAITFTSSLDDDNGGDTNNDARATTAAPGNWQAIQVGSGSATLGHLRLLYGGSGGQEVFINGGSVSLVQSLVAASSGNGVVSQNATGVQLTNNLILGSAAAGIRLGSGSLTAFNNTLDGNTVGVQANDGSLILTNNLVTNSKDAGVRASSSSTLTLSLSHNDVFGSTNKDYDGVANPTGTGGNISADPAYVSGSNPPNQLSAASPAISAATNTGAPTLDFLGNTRRNPTSIGAFESGSALPPAPVVTGLSPALGPTAGGVTVTITGTNLDNATQVDFGPVNLTRFASQSATRIVLVAPAEGASTVDVQVITPGGIAAINAPADQFTFAAPPAVTGLSASQGRAGGGTTLTISGSGFGGVTEVDFGPAKVTSFSSASATSITLTTPTGTGTVDVHVVAAGGASPVNAPADQFKFLPAPTVAAVSPGQGPSAGGTPITITGTDFTGATDILFGTTDVPASGFTVVSVTTITLNTPAHAVGTVGVQVTTAGGTSAAGSADQFTFVDVPAVSRIAPSSGPTAGGTALTITGSNFLGATAVAFGYATLTGSSFTVVSATTLTLSAPAHAAGAVDIHVTTPAGTSATGSADQFTYVAPPAITGIGPASGPTAGGTSVTITGTGFDGVTEVDIGSTKITSFSSTAPAALTFTTPAHGAGLVDLRVVTAAGGISPLNAPADQFNFRAPATTTFAVRLVRGNASVLSLTSVAAARSLLNTPAQQAATYTDSPAVIDYLGDGPDGHASLGADAPFPGTPSTSTRVERFAVEATANVIIPSAGNWTFGTSSDDGVGLTVGGLTLQRDGLFSPIDTFQTFNFPAAGVYPLDLVYYQNAGGAELELFAASGSFTTFGGSFRLVGDTAGGGLALSATAAPAPTITRLSPTFGPTAGGTTVTITGTNLATATEVDFGSTPVTTFTASATSITVSSPAATAAGPVDVRVVAAGGASLVSAADQFTYVDATGVTVQFLTDKETVDASAGTFSIPVTVAGLAPARRTFATGLGKPDGLTIDGTGNLYAADTATNTIRQVTPAGAVSTYATGLESADYRLAFGDAGNLYITNNDNGSRHGTTMSRVSPAGVVSSFASGFNSPSGVAAYAGNLYVGDSSNNRVARVSPAGAVTTDVAGIADAGALVFDAAGNLYVGVKIGSGNYGVDEVTPTGTVSPIVSGLPAGIEDLALDGAGNLYATQYASGQILRLSPTGATSIYASGLPGPVGLTVDKAGNLYVANFDDGTITEFSTATSLTVPLTLSGTAIDGTDYKGLTAGPLVIPAGATSAVLTGTLLRDPGSSRTLTLTLGTPTGATLGSPSVNTLTITEPAGTAPTVLSVTPSLGAITTAQLGGTFKLSIAYNTAMNPKSTPSISFSPAGAGSVLTSASGTWTSPRVYTATFKIGGPPTALAGVFVTVTGAQDTAGNTQAAYTSPGSAFSIDTTSPAATAVTPSAAVLTDAQLGRGGFTLSVTYSTAMNTGVFPDVSFSPSVASTLALASKAWSTATLYTVVYNVSDAFVSVAPVTAKVTGGRSVAGNLQTPATSTLAIDTVNPTVKAVTPSVLNLTAAQAGSGTFRLTIAFSGPMDTAVEPTLDFIPPLDTTLTPAGGSWDSTGSVFTKVYDVADVGVSISGVTVAVRGARSRNDNLQQPYVKLNSFAINTTIPSVLTATPSPTPITAAGTNAFRLTITYSTPMNKTVAPTLAFSPDVSANLTPGTGSGWDAAGKVYTAVYTVVGAGVSLTGIVATVTGGVSSFGNPQAVAGVSSPFDLTLSAATGGGGHLDVSVTAYNTSVAYNGQLPVFGETFVPNVTGSLTQLSILNVTGFYSTTRTLLASVSATVEIFQDGFNTNPLSLDYLKPIGPLLATQDATITVGTTKVVFATPPSLTRGKTYLWVVVFKDVFAVYANFATTNPYPQGITMGGPTSGYDLDFQTYMQAAAAAVKHGKSAGKTSS